jgi:vitamin B12 transporter
MSFFFSVFLWFFLSSFSSAAEPKREDTLAPVVVTATRMEQPREEVTTSVTVITAEEIRQQQAETVLEVLRNVPGLDVVQTGSRGNTTSVFIRGSDSDQVLVLVDGVEVNSTTTGAFEFAHLTTENVERIEILRGAGGTLYGSQAIGGVIHIITKAGKGPPEFSFSTEAGNHRTHRQVVTLRGGIERLGYSFSASRLETEGFHRFNDDYQNVATSTRLDFRVTENSLLKGIFHFRKTDLGLFNSNNFVPLADANARENVTDYLMKFDWEQKLLPQWDYRVTGSQFKQHDKFTDDPEPGSFDSVTRDRFRPTIVTGEFQTNYRWQEWSTTTFGIEHKKRQATTDSIRRDQRNLAYYLQEQLRFFQSRFLLVAGMRLDDHQVFGTEWSPSASAAYTIPRTGTKLKLGYAEGFKAPSMNELFFPGFGNPNLGPETSWEVSGGVEQRFLERFLVGVTYFHREVEDLIEFVPPTFVARNVGKVRLDGIELFGDVNLGHGLSLRSNYTFLENDISSGRLLRRPRHRGNILLNYQQEKFHINLNANVVGKRDDVGVVSGANVTEAGYAKFDLTSSYTLPWRSPGVKSLALFGKIENLFNKKYEEADGFRARPLNFLLGIRGVFGKE